MNDMVLRNSFDAERRAPAACAIRRRILDISQQVSALHIGSAYSCTEIVDCIYHGLMRRNPDGKSPDTFLMSKGHGCMIQYVILEDLGVLSRRGPRSLLQAGRPARLPSRLRQSRHRGVDRLARPRAVDGSVGMALAERGRKTGGVIYTVLSDGEVQEGSTWEAMMMASSLGCSNLVAFVDNNDFQSLGRTSETHPSFYPLAEKFEAFGWETAEVDGHDSAAVFEAVTSRKGDKPFMVVGQDHQGQGRQLHGERADLALPLAQQGGIRAGGRSSWSRRRHEKHLRRSALQGGHRRSRRLHRRGRHLAGRQHGQVQHAISGALHQRRRRRAEHDRHLRRPCAQGLPALRLHHRHLLALPSVRDGARRPVLPEPARHGGRHGRRRHLLHARRHAPHAGGHRHRRRAPEHADHRAVRSRRMHRGDRCTAPRRRRVRSICASARRASPISPTRRSTPGCSASCATSSAAGTSASSPTASS